MRKSKWAEPLRLYLIHLSRASKSTITATADVIGFGVCCVAVYWVLEANVAEYSAIVLVSTATVLSGISCVWLLGLYRSVVRFMGLDLIISAALISLGAATVGGLGAGFFVNEINPLRWGLTFFAFSLIYLISVRYFACRFLINDQSRNRENVLVYGAGVTGAQLVQSLSTSEQFRPVALIDDDRQVIGKRVNGLEVHDFANIDSVIEEHDVARVLLAMPSATRRRRRQVLERLSEHPVRVQTIPSVYELVSGKANVDEISDVDVDDLLGRDSVPPNPTLLRSSTTGKAVLITGAGGSIGSELCRQILDLAPSRLVLFDIAESALYNISRELKKRQSKHGSSVEVVSLLGSVNQGSRVNEIIRNFEIQTIYHAAAYKHVPIVEQNLFAGIQNNIFGTLHTARAALDCGIETFVLISTDKAVNPTNVMGATKRVAELILQAYNSRSPKTKFCMVRFGNVLESSGSVVPLFREQIRTGGPVTVTHREIIRYFMTIPEAAQLVIQSAALAQGGDVFVLDMGDPVKINDLASRMINLMGLTVRTEDNPDGDIAIEYIGLRPAEKLFEELLISSNIKGTEHPRIMSADEESLPYDALATLLDRLRQASIELDYETARQLLMEVVKEYAPANGIDDLAWSQAKKIVGGTESNTIIDFPGPLP